MAGSLPPRRHVTQATQMLDPEETQAAWAVRAWTSCTHTQQSWNLTEVPMQLSLPLSPFQKAFAATQGILRLQEELTRGRWLSVRTAVATCSVAFRH